MPEQVGGRIRRRPTPETLIVEFIDAEALAGRWPSARALHERFGGSYSRLLRIREDYSIANAGALPREEQRRARRGGRLSAAALAGLADHLAQALVQVPVRFDPRQFEQLIEGLEERIVRRLERSERSRLDAAPPTSQSADVAQSALAKVLADALAENRASNDRWVALEAKLGGLAAAVERAVVEPKTSRPQGHDPNPEVILEAALGRHRDAVTGMQREFLNQLGGEVSKQLNAMTAAARSVEEMVQTATSRIPMPQDIESFRGEIQAFKAEKKRRQDELTPRVLALVSDLVTTALNQWAEPLVAEMASLREQLAHRQRGPRKRGKVQAKRGAKRSPAQKGKPRKTTAKKASAAKGVSQERSGGRRKGHKQSKPVVKTRKRTARSAASRAAGPRKAQPKKRGTAAAKTTGARGATGAKTSGSRRSKQTASR